MAFDKDAAARAIESFLRAIGRDPGTEPDLVGTGMRVTEAFGELCAGYTIDTRALLRSALVENAPGGLVVVRDIPVVTTCPHHLLLATGKATVAIHTSDRVVGLGTISALVDAHARRLTLQEKIGDAVCQDIEAVLAPEWVAARIVLAHGCMIARGERASGTTVETVATRGNVPAKRLQSIYTALGVAG